MGAPRRWIKQFLGLKKSEKIASSEEENSSGNISKSWNQSKQSAEIENDRFENELNDNNNNNNNNVETEFEDANWQWDADPSGAPSTSLQAKNSAKLSEDRVQNAAQQQSQQDWREEWMGAYGKDANFQSALDSPNSPEVQNAAPDDDTGEGWATPDVRELNDSDEPSSPQFSSIEVEYALLQDNVREELEDEDDDADDDEEEDSPSTLLEEQSGAQFDQNMQEELAARCIQTAIRGFMLQDGAKTKTRLPMSEESAAIRIQTVYRGFLARRAFRAVKGLARLHALVKSHTVKRQAAIALRCIQALVKVQAHSRAKHVRIASENQSVQQKLIQQLEVEAPAPVKKPEGFKYDGWCDKIGSAAEVQARFLKRKEAAAKREKAKAYALARQWQAGIRQQPQQSQSQPQQQQQVAPVGFHSDKSEWGWNWLERWMAVRPWETHFLDEAREAMKSPVNERVAAVDVPSSPITERKPLSSNGTAKKTPRLSNTLNVSIEKRAISHFDGCNPSPRKLATAQDTPTTPVSSRSPRTPISRHIGSRSFSTPRERSNLSDNQEKKRLSLPGTMNGAKLLAQTAVKSPRTQSPRTQSPRIQSPRTPVTPGNSRSKLNGNDAKPSNLSR